MDKIPTVAELEDLSQLKSTVNVYYQPLVKDKGMKRIVKRNTLEEKREMEQATENKKRKRKIRRIITPWKKIWG